MKKAVITMGLSAVLVSPAVLADYEIYGKANLGIEQVDSDKNNGTDESKGDLESFASRIGIKGTQKLNDALSAIYKWEVEVDLTGDDAGTGLLKARNQFLGLKGNFGTVIGGIHDTPMKQAEGKIDLFSDIVDIARVQDAYLDTQEREKDFLGYYSPKFNNMQFQLATMPGKTDGNNLGDAYSTALVYGDKKLKKTPFFGAIAYDSDVDGNDSNAIRLSASTKVGKKLTVGGIIEEADNGKANTDKQKRYVLSAKYKLPNKNTLKFQVADSESVRSAGLFNATDITLGLSHKLAKTTSVYGLISSSDNAKNASGANQVDETRFVIGVVHKFKL